MSSTLLKAKLEAEIVRSLKLGLQDGRMTGDRAQEIARRILELVPENMSDDQLEQMIPQVGREVTELGPVVHDLLAEQDVEKTDQALKQLRSLLEKYKN